MLRNRSRAVLCTSHRADEGTDRIRIAAEVAAHNDSVSEATTRELKDTVRLVDGFRR